MVNPTVASQPNTVGCPPLLRPLRSRKLVDSAAAELLVLTVAPSPLSLTTGGDGGTRVMVSFDEGGEVVNGYCWHKR
jgi:hypothetical protein